MNQIESLVLAILYYRFSDSQKRKIGKRTSNRINFACPYCGDSKNSADKKRGNIYLTSKTFKCFNDGCPKNFCSLYEFISYWCQKYNIDINDVDSSQFQPEVESFDTDQALNTLRKDIINNKLIDVDKVINRFRLKGIHEAPRNSLAYKHAKSRCLYDVPRIDNYIKIDNYANKLYIINYDYLTNKLIGLYIRNLNHHVRYKMIKYSQILRSFGYDNNFTQSEIDMINYGASYFNITNVDFNRDNVKLVEGQIDSLFLNNAIGVSGISKSKNLINYISQFTKCYIIVDEDQSRYITQLLYQNYYVILWDYLKYKIKSYSKLPGQNLNNLNNNIDVNDLFIFLKKYNPSLTLNKFDRLICNYVSNNRLDTLLV